MTGEQRFRGGRTKESVRVRIVLLQVLEAGSP